MFIFSNKTSSIYKEKLDKNPFEKRNERRNGLEEKIEISVKKAKLISI